MTGFERVQLGGVASIRGGKRLPAGDEFTNQPTAHPYIRARDIGGGKVEIQEPVFLPEQTAQKLWRYTVKKGDVCLTIVGANVGEMGVVPSGLAGANLTENAVKITTNGRVDQAYLKFALLSENALAQMKVLAGGAAQPKLGIYKIETIEIPFPPLRTQRKIAAILESYDQLIENCQRRIRILAEMARALYREWFVHFRFPGHEKVPRVDSSLGKLARGWEAVAFTEIADVLSGGTPKTDVPEFWDGGIPFFTPRDAPACFYVLDTDKHTTELGLSKCASELYPPDTVFITARGTVGKVAMPSVPMAMNQSCYALRGKPGIPQRFLFLMTLQQVDYLKTNTGGATFDTIVVDTFRRMAVAKPPPDLIARFARLTDPTFEAINNLAQKVANLRRTRDLLLPRLLSGQVSLDVSAVENVAEPTAPAPPLSQTDLASEEPALRAAEEATPYHPRRRT